MATRLEKGHWVAEAFGEEIGVFDNGGSALDAVQREHEDAILEISDFIENEILTRLSKLEEKVGGN